MSPEELISRYGYFALFAGAIFEGETVVIAASYAAHQGYLDLYWVVVISFLGSVVGDESYFFLGRIKGKAYLANRPALEIRVRRVRVLIERFHKLVILGFRFLYGFRTVTPFALGMSDVKTSHFVVLNIIGAFTWSVVMGAFGFLIGTVARTVIVDVRRYDVWILVIILIPGIVVWLRYVLRKRRLRMLASAELARRKKEAR